MNIHIYIYYYTIFQVLSSAHVEYDAPSCNKQKAGFTVDMSIVGFASHLVNGQEPCQNPVMYRVYIHGLYMGHKVIKSLHTY